MQKILNQQLFLKISSWTSKSSLNSEVVSLRSFIFYCIALIALVIFNSQSIAQETTQETIQKKKSIDQILDQNSIADEILNFDNEEQKEIYQELILELRCPKCQNQNIADSNADIAKDLRQKVYEMAIQDKDKNEIKDFMLSRFGEFVLYKPQLTGKTMLLWAGPFVLLFIIIFFVIRLISINAQFLDSEDADTEN